MLAGKRSSTFGWCGLIVLGRFVAACGGGPPSGGVIGSGGATMGTGGTLMGTGGATAGTGGAGQDAASGDGRSATDKPTPPPADALTIDSGGADVPITPCVPGTGTEMIGAESVRDRATCLTWQREASMALMTNKQAAKFCDGLSQDGFTDWRVPAPEELATWPNLAANSNAYITNPIYIPNTGTVADGCTGNSHSCNISEYNPGAPACAWQGVGFAGPTVCVRGTAAPGTTSTKFAATNCDACKTHVTGATADFHAADCSAYAM